MKRDKLLLSLCFVIVSYWSAYGQSATDTVYVFLQDQPNAGIYLPAPPDTASQVFASDFLTWQYGKTIRPTARGKQASDESLWIPEEMIRINAEAMGIEITREKTPAIFHFLYKVARGGDFATKAAKEKYMRRRPFDQMNEHTWGEYDDEAFLSGNGSYPSGHTSMGWTTSLAAAEIAPELQDTILRRGFQFGEDRWIVGAHWLSDVNAGYLCGAATLARAHANPVYYEELEAARAEYRKIKGTEINIDTIGYPDGQRILSEPVDTSSFLYYGDVITTYESMRERNSYAGERAIIGHKDKTYDMLRYFSPGLDINVSETETPHIYAMLEYAREAVKQPINAMKNQYFRKRPYVQLGFSTLIPEENEKYSTTSSYPSFHSAIGWVDALLLTEVMPDCQNAILTIGHEFGYNRIVAGFHYASDVQAGRMIASYTVARLHCDKTFMELMKAAKTEYQQKKSSTDIQAVMEQSANDNRTWYSVTGQSIGNSKPTQTGIYINNGQKIFIK